MLRNAVKLFESGLRITPRMADTRAFGPEQGMKPSLGAPNPVLLLRPRLLTKQEALS